MEKERKYRIALTLNLVSLILTSIGVGFGILGLLMMSFLGSLFALIVLAPFLLLFLIMPIIAQVTISKEIKNGCKNRHTGLAVCLIIFGGLFGLISAIMILIGDGETSAVQPIVEDGQPSEYLDF